MVKLVHVLSTSDYCHDSQRESQSSVYRTHVSEQASSPQAHTVAISVGYEEEKPAEAKWLAFGQIGPAVMCAELAPRTMLMVVD